MTDVRWPNYRWLKGTSVAMCLAEGLTMRREGRWLIPDFQRPLVWTVEQKVRFIESLLTGLPVGEYALHRDNVTADTYTVLDGQQRWSAIFGYVDDEFPVFGLKWSDLNNVEIRLFKYSTTFPVRIVEGMSREEQFEAYTKLAYGGTPHVAPDFSQSQEGR